MDEMHITKEMFRSIKDDHPLSKPIDAIQDNIIAYNEMFADLPEMTVFATDEIYWCFNQLDVPENYVYRTRLGKIMLMHASMKYCNKLQIIQAISIGQFIGHVAPPT